MPFTLTSIVIPEVYDSSIVSPGTEFVLANGPSSAPGQAMGVMGLTYSSLVVDNYQLSYKTNENSVIAI